jgi:predicted NBD/HSP70 family sugar kinase
MPDSPIWGIDLGGSKIECAVLASADNPETLFRRRIPTQGDRGYRHVLGRIAGLIAEAGGETGLTPTAVGIGTPGSLDPDSGLLRGSNSQHLQHQPFHKDMEAILGVPVAIGNDANCFALAETRLGAVTELEQPVHVVFGIIMGTGVGGGLVVNGRLIPGANRIAGEWGHNHLDDSGGPCYCGRSGCVETVLSGPALERFYLQRSGIRRSLREIESLADSDPHARRTLDRLVEGFGRGVSGLVNILDPDVIVIGGGVGNISRLYSDGVQAVAAGIFSPTMKTRIIKPVLGDSAGVIGAAYLVADTASA